MNTISEALSQLRICKLHFNFSVNIVVARIAHYRYHFTCLCDFFFKKKKTSPVPVHIVVTRIPHVVVIAVLLVGVRHRNTVVTRVAQSVAILVGLVRVVHQRAVVALVGDS